MSLKRALIVAPFILVLLLAQSYFWVPTYESQALGNPNRLTKFIEASIGDAKILNPILSADSASSRITLLVFDGLLELDEHLQLTGRLATDWQITETAYVLSIDRPAEDWLADIRHAIVNGTVTGLDEARFSVIPAESRTETVTVKSTSNTSVEVTLSARLPARIRIDLPTVDQDLSRKLSPVFGDDYWQTPVSPLIEVTPIEYRDQVTHVFPEVVRILEHNPIIDFTLRRGVQFHDGHLFDANDVKFTYEALMNPRNLSPRTSDFEPIKSVEVVDTDRIRVTYKRLFSPAINAWTMGILPEHLLNEEAIAKEMDRRNLSQEARDTFGLRDTEFNRNPIGTGAFVFSDWQSDELIHLVRNEHYWDAPPLYEDFYFRIIPDALTQEVEFLTGAIDTYAPQPHQVARYKDDSTYQSFSALGFNYSYIGYNMRRPLFHDARVRRALGMAINVDEILEYILYDEAKRVTGPYAKKTQWYDEDIAALPYDPAGALALLEEVGWKRNADGWLEKDGEIFEFNLITNNGNLVRKAILTTVQDAWKRIGVKCNTQLFEWAVFLEDFINPAQFDAVVLGWGLSPDPDLYVIWHSSQTGFGQFNFVGYDNPRADELIIRIRREYDIDEQRKLARELHQLIADDQPYTFLFSSLVTRILDKKIVMRDGEENVPLRAADSGDLFYYFNRWHKLEHAPKF